ncbi:c-type cytochrome biogenesis protein CcmI [Vibrio sp. S4M6]|uniref:c-type cytochrome biogenesis protein CcmI n=1 Tax=Vibrio sinus TaxID=2946865 RepID=UPI002029B997|nr:c-type cytochrome biogenesis protein CcmI [Vibrio sinus]MCL9781816.1 c-type cytochrome biogenesis protein CcmI [Vibrio sinus]
MAIFWFATVAIVLFGCLIVAFPLFKRSDVRDQAARDELNKAFYKDRLGELAQEADAGLVGNNQEMVNDLKQSLLDDIPETYSVGKAPNAAPKAIIVLSMVFVVVVSYSLYLVYGGLKQVQDWHQVSARLPELSKKLMTESSQPMTEQELNDLTLALRTRLFYQPGDAMGWLLLGKIGIASRDSNTAVDAMQRAYKMNPNSPTIQLGYAQALMTSQEESDHNLARKLLQGLIEQGYANLQVLSMIAFDAFEGQQYQRAIEYWQQMQRLISPEDERYAMLEKSIALAKQEISGKTKDISQSVPVTVSLGQGVVVKPNSVLIVSVHTPDGAPMPVAAARYPASQFPVKMVLDDSNSMIQGRKISDLSAVIVKARIDTDGNVSTKKGDWYGESSVVKLGQPINIIIDKQFR